MKRASILILTTFVLTICPLMQAAGSVLRGTVTAGPNTTPIANAHVVLRGGNHERATFSNEEGSYEFSSVEPANYSISVDAEGLNQFSKSDIAVRDGETTRVDVSLQLADVHTTVLVSGGIINLEATSAEVSQTIDSTEIHDLPVTNRTVAKYALLDPHVRQTLGLGADYQDSMRLSINAGSYRHTSYMLDGATNYDWVYAVTPQANVLPSSVDEVKVITGDPSAQYGGSSDGIISITTPSGTNTLHGDFFSYIRPSGIQANPELAMYKGGGFTPPPGFHVPNQRVDWGGNMGGALIQNKTFFFASYERMQQDRGAVITLPSLGFFDGQTNEYASLFRLDHNLTNKNTLTVRLNGDHYATDNSQDRVAGGNQPSYGRTQRVQSWGGQVSDQAVIGNMVNVARFSHTNYFPDSATPLDPSVGLLVKAYANGVNYQSGNSAYSWVHAQTETAGDMLALRSGRHSLKFGGEFVHQHVKDYSFTPYGSYTFNSLAHFQANLPDQYTQTYGAADVRYGQNEMSAFVQDDIRLSPRLTANLGLRYEFQSITDSHHNLGPRIGLAWDATGDGKTMVRVGGSVLFDQYYMYLTRRFLTLGLHTPQQIDTWNCTDTGVVCPVYPTPSVDPSTSETQKLLNPYSIQFSASVERELTHNLVLTISGLQSHTMKQMRVNDIDHPTPYDRQIGTTPRTTAQANATRPFWNAAANTCIYHGVQGACLVDQIENTASSIYQSFDASLKERFSRWGEFNAHYVFSGSYATAMFYADYNSGIPSEWLPNWNAIERSPSDFYQRHHLILDAVLRGPYKTTMALVGSFGSGLPVNPLTGQDDNGDGYTADRPVGIGRNSFRAPTLKTVDISVGKQFTLRERFRADTRIEALNVLNSKNFINVNSTYGEGTTPASSFLTPLAGIANTDPSRQWQFVVRLSF
jgi:hypothetical protein